MTASRALHEKAAAIAKKYRTACNVTPGCVDNAKMIEPFDE